MLKLPPVLSDEEEQKITESSPAYIAAKQTSVTPPSAENIIPTATKFDSTVLKTPVDFTNMTPNEFNELYKSGHFAELPPIALPSGLDLTKDSKSQMEASLDTKFNYVDMVEKEITFNKSVGMPTEYLVKQLNLMKNFNA